MFPLHYFGLLACLFLIALLAASEAALAATNRVRLRHLLRAQAAQTTPEEQGAAQLLSSELSGDAQRFLATVTIAANMPLLAAAAFTVGMARARFGPGLAAIVACAVVALGTVAVFQITPRLLVSQPGALDRLWWVRPARLMVALLRPPVALLMTLGSLLLRPLGVVPARRALPSRIKARHAAARNKAARGAGASSTQHDVAEHNTGEDTAGRDAARGGEDTSAVETNRDEAADNGLADTSEIRDLVESAQASGAIEESGKELIESIFTFGDTRVREVMLPRPDILALPVDSSAERVLDALQQSGFSRLPLHEGTIDRIAGMLHAKDVLAALGRGEHDFSARALMRPALYLPESKKIDEALGAMRAARTHLAIAIDEYGGTAGLLTVEDILEELVGDIADEHDRPTEEPVQMLDENTALVEAALHTEDLHDEWPLPWKLALPAGEFDSVGGLMIEHLGRALEVGDRIEVPGATLTVHSVRERRPHKILITRRGGSAIADASSSTETTAVQDADDAPV